VGLSIDDGVEVLTGTDHLEAVDRVEKSRSVGVIVLRRWVSTSSRSHARLEWESHDRSKA